MGTNYYTASKKCKCCGHELGGIHLGKSSAGWQFSFQYNGGRYYTTVKEMKRWLIGKSIVDEYGRKVPQDKFWKMVAEKQGGLRNTSHCMDLGGYDFINSDFS